MKVFRVLLVCLLTGLPVVGTISCSKSTSNAPEATQATYKCKGCGSTKTLDAGAPIPSC